MHSAHQISLGFTDQRFDPGVHICQIYSEKDERQESLLNFILSGIQSGEMSACFSENIREEAIDEFLANYGISYSEQKDKGSFVLSGTTSAYLDGGRFVPERMLKKLEEFYRKAMTEGDPVHGRR